MVKLEVLYIALKIKKFHLFHFFFCLSQYRFDYKLFDNNLPIFLFSGLLSCNCFTSSSLNFFDLPNPYFFELFTILIIGYNIIQPTTNKDIDIINPVTSLLENKLIMNNAEEPPIKIKPSIELKNLQVLNPSIL